MGSGTPGAIACHAIQFYTKPLHTIPFHLLYTIELPLHTIPMALREPRLNSRAIVGRSRVSSRVTTFYQQPCSNWRFALLAIFVSICVQYLSVFVCNICQYCSISLQYLSQFFTNNTALQLEWGVLLC